MPTPRQYDSDADRQRAYRQRMKQARLDELAAKGLPPTPAIPTMPGTARWTALLEQARLALQTAYDEMEAYHSERTDAWRNGENAAAMQERMDSIETVISDLEAITLP